MQLSDLTGKKADATLNKAGGVEIAGLTADSREVRPGWLFAALPGANHDGAAFVSQAEANGAAAILAAGKVKAGVPVIPVTGGDPRRCLARMAARFYRSQPDVVVGVTGTNGKSSIVWFLRQIWAHEGLNAAALGTLGVTTRNVHVPGHIPGGLTTPDPVALHRLVAALANDGITHLALEASSHGLDQRRLDGLRLAAGAFTNLGRDHLDYHPDADSYLAAKLRLFEALLPKGAPTAICLDSETGRRVAAAAGAAGLKPANYGRNAEADFRYKIEKSELSGQHLQLQYPGGRGHVRLPLVGAFQAENAVGAFALAVSLGARPDVALAALGHLQGAPGRLQPAGRDGDCAAFVDYSHTPDALAAAIAALRPHAKGRIVTVFGCGGDRDRAKRPLMGQVAAELSDVAIVTDDNPRTEDPAAIRAEIMAACPDAIETGDRREAIFAAIAMLQPGDVALIAGKGHESDQIIGQDSIAFDDLQVTGEAMENRA